MSISYVQEKSLKTLIHSPQTSPSNKHGVSGKSIYILNKMSVFFLSSIWRMFTLFTVKLAKVAKDTCCCWSSKQALFKWLFQLDDSKLVQSLKPNFQGGPNFQVLWLLVSGCFTMKNGWKLTMSIHFFNRLFVVPARPWFPMVSCCGQGLSRYVVI